MEAIQGHYQLNKSCGDLPFTFSKMKGSGTGCKNSHKKVMKSKDNGEMWLNIRNRIFLVLLLLQIHDCFKEKV